MPLLSAVLGLVVLQGGWKTVRFGSDIQGVLPTDGARWPEPPNASGSSPTGWSGTDAGGNEVTLAHVPLPKGRVNSFDELAAGFMEGGLEGSRLLTQSEFLLRGWPGIRYTAAGSPGHLIHGQIVVIKRGIVSVLVQGAKPAPSMERVVKSLRLPPPSETARRRSQAPHGSAIRSGSRISRSSSLRIPPTR